MWPFTRKDEDTSDAENRTTVVSTSPSGQTVIGMTGAFGSGCTTAAKHLRDKRHFTRIRLSDAIRDRWRAEHGDREPLRGELQRLGDSMRFEGGASVLVDEALKGVVGHTNLLVIDGIRNTNEVRALEERFGYHFFLMGIMASAEERWSRLGQEYSDDKRTQVDFVLDDERDRNEEINSGQQVELCLDRSDVFINNEGTLGPLFEKVIAHVDLLSGAKVRPPNIDEIHMNLAYGASHSSKCIKRHVGAVVVDPQGQVIGTGYNENPLGTKPCIEEPEYDFTCYRDIVRNEHFANLAVRGTRCPACGEPLSGDKGPPWRCNSCARKNPSVKTNLENLFFPDRALNWCTAIHAEVWALKTAGDRAKGGTLFTTAFPCFQCAEQIIHAGISEVVYTEAYPDVKGELRLKLAKEPIKMRRFEGVRSASFHRIFDPNRPR
jgi:deoxycytidylate deaminase